MRRRLLLGYLGLTLIVLVTFGVPLGVIWTSKVRSDELASLASSSTELANSAATPLMNGLVAATTDTEPDPLADKHEAGSDNDSATPTLKPSDLAQVRSQLRPYTGGEYREVVALLDRNGQSFAAVGPLRASSARLLTRAAITRVVAGGTVTGSTTVGGETVLYAAAPVVATPSVASDRVSNVPVTGITVIADSSTITSERVRAVILGLLGLGALALVIAALAGWGLVRSLVRPLLRIQDAVARIGSGDLAARAPTEKAPPELAALGETVNTMALRLGELISAQRAFVADASHQLRTPLTALRLRLENLATGEPVDSAHQTGILAEVDRLARLVTGLLALARAEETPPRPLVADVAEIVLGRALAWRPVASEQGIVLSAVDSPAMRALVIPDDLEQALDNLIDNALRLTPAGGTVRLGLADDGAMVELHVADEGPGMSVQDREHAFDRFWSGRAERNTGSGLGLAIVDRLVRNMSGEVELRGAEGHGLDAVIRLRRAR
ncbi:MAG: signal transduction histidine kinase [Acidimicrobiaceae bacterium]|nr:signal transduction histidine kinase [Acidimicrobiaceae bacterium]